jgi:two-component system LytT family sensor kinase
MNNHSEISTFRLESRHYDGGHFADWRLALKSILGFWLFYALTVVSRAFLGSDPWTVLENKTVTIVAGIVLTACIYVAIRLFALRATLGRRAVVATAGSFFAAAAMAGVLIAADRYQDKPQDEQSYVSREGYRVIELGNTMRIERDGQAPLTVTWPHISALNPYLQFRIAADSAVVWLFFFAAWSAFYIAMLAQGEALGARRRAAEAESAARSAQVRALRYQVNPHFLFNTLNSLSSLVMSGRPAEAESMILKLSTFFRSSLSLDPSADVTLAEEIALQTLYLDIERVRFPKRLKVEIDVPPNLETARLPALVLQPVVENAIKYGVSPTREKVILKISAREAGPGRFRLEVSNTGKLSKRRTDGMPEGTGVGLGNVCERLRARFGTAVQCEFGPIDEGGYRVVMTLPLDRTDG